MEKKTERCALYIRVSTAEQMMHGKSLEAQRESLERYAHEHGMSVAGIYADEGKTARKGLKNRKAIHALLDDVRARKIDVILFWRLDRWFRNMSDFYKVQDILDEYGVRWISISEPGINMETRDGRLQLNVVLSIGQNEVDTTSERIKFVNEASVRQGRLIFGEANMPMGYKAGLKDGVKCMVKDPETEAATEDFFRYFMAHQNKSATIRYMQESYGLSFSRSMMKSMLSSEFYKGTYRGFPYCPAYLSPEEWAKIQKISANNIKHAPSGRIYLFSGILRCPSCGQILAGTGCSSIANRKTGEKRAYCYYRCNRAHVDKTCSFRSRVSQNALESYLLKNLESELGKWKLQKQDIAENARNARTPKSPKTLKAEMSRLTLLYQKGRVEWDYYNKEYTRIENALRRLSSPPPDAGRDLSHLESLFQSGLASAYEALSSENRQSFWHATLKQIHLNDDGSLKYVVFL